ncbi:hypothetical protein HanRHA438_Chr01g0035141 [Helianthus annuus]|nr:hypothetical protein HanRHA438_Chr01g0035141 [Helianthus annuus]
MIIQETKIMTTPTSVSKRKSWNKTILVLAHDKPTLPSFCNAYVFPLYLLGNSFYI